jgi:branched-chain amino acid transport system substrate-binding protein
MHFLSKKIGVSLVALALSLGGVVALSAGGAASAAAKHKAGTISVGTLYATTGAYASSSMPEYAGLKFWAKLVNAHGGMYVKPLKKKEKVKIVAYNDQSNPATATTLYDQLLSQNHVGVFVADFGSVLTAPAVTIAKDQKHIVFDPTGTGTTFFDGGANPYLVLTGLPVSSIWPLPLVKLLEKLKAKKIAILYCQNDFDQAQANTIQGALKKSGITPVYFQGVPGTQSDYSTLVQSIKATNPDAVLELGFPNNDIAFLNELASTGTHFPFLLTAFPGQLPSLFASSVGAKELDYTYTYGVPPTLKYNAVNSGIGINKFIQLFSHGKVSTLNFASVAGYNTGLAIQAAYANATSMTQLGVRAGISKVSGKMHTLEGLMKWNAAGAQLGELLPISQIVPQGKKGFQFKIVYPGTPQQVKLVNAKPRYPAPSAP